MKSLLTQYVHFREIYREAKPILVINAGDRLIICEYTRELSKNTVYNKQLLLHVPLHV